MFAFLVKSKLKCTWMYAADVDSRQHFQDSGRVLDSKLRGSRFLSLTGDTALCPLNKTLSSA